MLSNEEKTLILAALFHDIGKFQQRCTGNPDKKFHQELGKELILSGRFQHLFEKIVGIENISRLAEAIEFHHNKEINDSLIKIIQEADRLSASERVEKEEVEAYQDQWKHKHLASLFSKIKILSNESSELRYYKHKWLTKKDYDVIIPTETKESELKEFAYNESDWNSFLEDLEYVLNFYEGEKDFESLINLFLIIFEKYMWCIPDFTGSSETDISLYNHLKDVAGIAHAVYLTKKDNPDSTNLNLVIGDIPGIQSYIFDVIHKKPAKILRGRSIFIQVLTRNLATKLLRTFGLTETNLIMLAGGKFYLIAPATEDFERKYKDALIEINKYLYDNFRMELSFNCVSHNFDYMDLMDKNNPLTFGKIVEDASHKLIENKYRLFNERFFPENGISYQNYIWEEKYVDNDGTGTDSIKCRVTDKPIRWGRKSIIQDFEEEIVVDKQVKNEYEIGSKITGNNIIAILNNDNLSIDPNNIIHIKSFKDDKELKEKTKILLNPTLDELLKKENLSKDIFRNTHYIEVANYCSRNEKGDIMSFEDMAKYNNGAKFLSLIKGDIDNLGLIMAYGLDRDKNSINNDNKEKDLTGISRTTTLSNHLKYFFSFFLNGFLAEWENKASDNKVYTIFAGGDDLMIVTPQSSALRLVKAINDEFSKFTCDNKELHISYSTTNFKDHTPIRIVADFAEENQKEGKKCTEDSQRDLLRRKSPDSFFASNDKAGTYLFDTFVKNDDLSFLMSQIDKLTMYTQDEKNGLSHGLIRKLFELSESLRKYEETEDATYLISYARLNYTVNRLLRNKDPEIVKFFENILTISKEGNIEAQKLEKILHPLVCQVIYNIRK